MKFLNNNNNKPFLKFRNLYTKACDIENIDIEAALIASLDVKNNEVEARYVNIKILDGKKFIFFSNYNSPKAEQFKLHNQAALVFYWPLSDIQIRIKGKIEMIAAEYSDNFFMNRSSFKNALAICSEQSQPIDSYKMMKEKYKDSLQNNNLTVRPKYWGGYSLIPYYFEFWVGHPKRLNKREAYSLLNKEWQKSFLQP